MQTFSYPLLFRLLFRYANIPVNLILLFYIYLSAVGLNTRIINFIPLLIIITALYFINKRYLLLYKILPYKIEADEEKITCSDYLMSAKRIVIYYKDIDYLKGGVFEGKISGVMMVHDGSTGSSIGFFNNLRNADKLQTLILSKIRRDVYDKVLEKVGMEKNTQQKGTVKK